jgi:branched-chain amino acid transport system permease protein
MIAALTPRTIAVAVVIAMLALVPVYAHLVGNLFVLSLFTRIVILAIAAVSLNLIMGFGGMVSFGHAAYIGIGGYVVGILAHEGVRSGFVQWPLAILLSAIFALGIGALSLRTRGVYFIMVTLAFAQMLYYFAISWPAYGGEDGLSFYVRNAFPGLNTLDPLQFFLIPAGLLAAALGLTAVVTRSRFGLALRAVRENEQRAVAVGIRPFPVRLTAFVLSGMITGLAGALYADLNRFVSPAMMSWHMSGEIMVFLILGGVGRLTGPVAGAAVYVLLEHLLGPVSEHWQALLGLLLLAVVLVSPGGLIGLATGGRRHG